MLFKSKLNEDIYVGDIIVNLGLWSPMFGVVRWYKPSTYTGLEGQQIVDFRRCRLGVMEVKYDPTWVPKPNGYGTHPVGPKEVRYHKTYFNSVNGVLKTSPEELLNRFGLEQERIAALVGARQTQLREQADNA